MVEKEKKLTRSMLKEKAYEIADIENLQKYYGKFDIVMPQRCLSCI